MDELQGSIWERWPGQWWYSCPCGLLGYASSSETAREALLTHEHREGPHGDGA